jgi:hypothetical protein
VSFWTDFREEWTGWAWWQKLVLIPLLAAEVFILVAIVALCGRALGTW